jgi:hypothetical protein
MLPRAFLASMPLLVRVEPARLVAEWRQTDGAVQTGMRQSQKLLPSFFCRITYHNKSIT